MSEPLNLRLSGLSKGALRLRPDRHVRSYVFGPTTFVKDLRTDVTHPDPEAVFNGDLDRFLVASLSHPIGG